MNPRIPSKEAIVTIRMSLSSKVHYPVEVRDRKQTTYWHLTAWDVTILPRKSTEDDHTLRGETVQLPINQRAFQGKKMYDCHYRAVWKEDNVKQWKDN